jgi:glycosyltransferase involved in cell wall biosynthesis
VSFAGTQDSAHGLAALAELGVRVLTVPLHAGWMAAGIVQGNFRGLPLQVGLYDSPRMRTVIRDALRQEAYDLVHVQLARMATYLRDVHSLPRVVDLVDALSLNMARRSRHDRGLGRWGAHIDSKRLRRLEKAICTSVDRTLVGSRLDAETLGWPPRLTVVANGVDLTEFPYRRTGREADTVIFSGNMGYFPNVHGALWFGQAILPVIARAIPGIRFQVVGARPHPTVRRLASVDPRVSVMGRVDHVSPHLLRAAVAVAPIRAGSGQPLKVLEAMASGTPVVTTSLVAASIEARAGEHLLVADEPDALAHHIVQLLRDPDLADRLAMNGRRLIEERYTWEHSVGALENIYRSVLGKNPLP